MLISFALGVATGIVQEFQFGMNWSNYSRFVGDIFGAPLAMEGLAAFFVESTFLGLWIFGWGKLSKGVHLACAWAVAGSTALSAYFILAANSWMQHPVGYDVHNGRPRLTNIFDVLFNNTAIYALRPHDPGRAADGGDARAWRSRPGTCGAAATARACSAHRCGWRSRCSRSRRSCSSSSGTSTAC